MKRLVSIIIIIASVLIIFSLLKSIYTLWKKQDLVIAMRVKLENEKKENQKLSQQLEIVKKPEYIEEQARNKLFLSKPQEAEVLLGEIKDKKQGEKPSQKRSNWRRWVTFFFEG